LGTPAPTRAVGRSSDENGEVIRTVAAEDLSFLEAMLVEAVCWRADRPRPPAAEVLSDPHVARYVEGWGRSGDAGVLAVEGRQAVGAAWYRLFTSGRPGYGFVDERTPELSLGVMPRARGLGVGTDLLHAQLEQARIEGFRAISLSVEADNPAVRLYERVGFTRAGGVGAWRMVAAL
jgi:ribosomal protein S18 acetylase RimI-like enzyme